MTTRTEAELDRLEAAALSWCGTPFCELSAIKGAGVSCQHAVAEVFFESGWLPRLIIPDAPLNWARCHGDSRMEEWFDDPDRGGKYFVPMHPDNRLPGDLLGFRFGRCVHHLKLLLRDGHVFHAMETVGAGIAPALQSRALRRLVKIWRPCRIAPILLHSITPLPGLPSGRGPL